MRDLSKQIFRLLQTGESPALATVIRSTGSTPRSAGAKMVVRENGEILGTIGGGAVEGEVIRIAQRLIDPGQAILRQFDFSSSDQAESLGMICGGDLTVLIERFSPDSEDMEIFSRMQSGERCLLLVAFSKEGDGLCRRCLVTEGSCMPGESSLPETVILSLKETAFKTRLPVISENGSDVVIADPIVPGDCAFLFGAGHVSQQTAALLHTIDFRTVVIDDRREFANRTRFPDADDIRVPTAFEDAFSGLPVNENSVIVILTRGHAHDQTVLEQALKTNAGYIGMIGSRRKRDTLYEQLSAKGVSRHALDRVRCPIGLDIGAKTPAEIAVSILAEIIAHRAGRTP